MGITSERVPVSTGEMRLTGAAYVGVILLGLTAELVLRAAFNELGDAQLPEALAGLRLASLADAGMIMLDLWLALAFWRMLAPFGRATAQAATLLRLTQAAIIAGALLFQLAALEVAETAPQLARHFMATHAAGYDLGLLFFGANALLMARLLCLSGLAPRWLSALIGVSGLVYLAGSLTRFAAPEWHAAMQPAYALPVLAETALALRLLLGPRPGPARAPV
ncbi:DUF4386 family protein [Aquicoccus sp. SCR17]|nr:DUF4386 family protein [Carideicomes alvinocaridis]